jgi:hypothetical protein
VCRDAGGWVRHTTAGQVGYGREENKGGPRGGFGVALPEGKHRATGGNPGTGEHRGDGKAGGGDLWGNATAKGEQQGR